MSALFPDVADETSASRVLRRHWGGWLFAAAFIFTLAVVLFELVGQESASEYAVIEAVIEVAYLGFMALAAAFFTWLMVRRRKAWAGFVLLALIVLAIVLAFIGTLDEGAPPIGPYLFLRLWMGLSIVNGIRATLTLAKSDKKTQLPIVISENGGRSVRPLTSMHRIKLQQWQRLWLFASACWLVVGGFLLVLFDPRADVVDGEGWKVLALLVAPPLFAGAGYWIYRRFVVGSEMAPETGLLKDQTPSVTAILSSAALKRALWLGGLVLVAGLGWMIISRYAPVLPPAMPQLSAVDILRASEERERRDAAQRAADAAALARQVPPNFLADRAARELGIAPILAREVPGTIAEAQASREARALTEAPRTAAVLADPNKAAVAHD